MCDIVWLCYVNHYTCCMLRAHDREHGQTMNTHNTLLSARAYIDCGQCRFEGTRWGSAQVIHLCHLWPIV